MPWKPAQIKLFMTACRGAAIGDEHRYLILGQCEGRAVIDGRVSAKSPRLNNDDFEHCMAVVEGFAGGRVLDFAPGHWRRAAETGVIGRARYRVGALVDALAAADIGWQTDPAASLLAWVRSSNCAAPERLGAIHSAEDLHLAELRRLIDSLTALAKRHGIPTHRSAA